jgi:hypothetical protein
LEENQKFVNRKLIYLGCKTETELLIMILDLLFYSLAVSTVNIYRGTYVTKYRNTKSSKAKKIILKKTYQGLDACHDGANIVGGRPRGKF